MKIHEGTTDEKLCEMLADEVRRLNRTARALRDRGMVVKFEEETWMGQTVTLSAEVSKRMTFVTGSEP